MKHDGRRFSPGALGAILAAIVLCGWILAGTAGLSRIGGRQADYNNLLVHGFLRGHLYLDQAVPPELLALKNPYDPGQRPPGVGLHDASLFNGRYYIYFGPAPAVTVMLPFAVLTGNDLPVGYAVGLFVLGSSAAMLAIFWRYLRRFRPEASGRLIAAACLLALGTNGLQLVLLSRHTMYELAVAGGSCFFLWSLFCGWGALPPPRLGSDREPSSNSPSAVIASALAGLLLGLAVASRPIYLFTAPLLALPLLRRGGGRAALAGLGACGLIGAILLIYNYERFGNFWEFGQNYQLSGAIEGDVRHFSLHNVPFNLRVYFLSVLRYGRYFPFVHHIVIPPLPEGFGGYEEAFGLLPNFPFYLLAVPGLYFVLAGRNEHPQPVGIPEDRAALPGSALGEQSRVSPSDDPGLRSYLLPIAAAGLILTAVLCLFFGSVVRYEADFCGPLLLLACCGAIEMDARLTSRSARRLFSGLALGLALFGAFVAAMTGTVLYHDFATASPGQFARLSHVLDFPALALERLGLLSPPGPRALRVDLPPLQGRRRELLVTTGWAPEDDKIWAVQSRPGRVQFQWIHGGLGVLATSPDFELGNRTQHAVAISLGSFYPPDDASYFGGLTPEEVGRRCTILALSFDHQPPWRLHAGFFESSPGTILPGPAVTSLSPLRDSLSPFAPSAGSPALFANSLTPSGSSLAAFGDNLAPFGSSPSLLQLEVRLEAGWVGRSFPLVSRGRSFAGDTLYVRVVDRQTVSFGYDHWGHPSVSSPPVPWVMGWPHKLSLDLPSPAAKAEVGPIKIVLDGAPVWQAELPFYPARIYEVFPAQNLIGASSCESFFPAGSMRLGQVSQPSASR